MYTLLVIDMQRGFLKGFKHDEEREKVIENCRRAVVKAIADGAEIIDVNYRGSYGPTIGEIRNLWRRYKKLFKGNVKKVVKWSDGGGDEVMEAEPQYFDMLACGINAGACVRFTVLELYKKHKQNVHVIASAVANSWGSCDSDLKYFRNNGILIE